MDSPWPQTSYIVQAENYSRNTHRRSKSTVWWPRTTYCEHRASAIVQYERWIYVLSYHRP